MKTPNFFIIGTAKAGTTSLFNYLGQFDNIGLAKIKEPHFFDVNYNEGVKLYLETHFSHCQHQRCVGEATPHYLFVSYAARRIYYQFPNAKLIAVLRNPVDRAYSDWWMYWSRAREPLQFKNAVRNNMNRLSTGPFFNEDDGEDIWCRYYHSSCEGTIGIRPYIEMGYYASQIRNYLQYFPRKQMKFILFEELQRQPERVVNECLYFLGVDVSLKPNLNKIHNYALGGYTRPLFSLFKKTGAEHLLHSFPNELKITIKKIMASLGRRPSMDKSLKIDLIKHYGSYNKDLESILDKDLSFWNCID